MQGLQAFSSLYMPIVDKTDLATVEQVAGTRRQVEFVEIEMAATVR